MRLVLTAALVLAAPAAAAAQSWLDGPIVLELARAGRLVLGGEASAVAGERDEAGFFNYTDYEHNTLRMLRLALAARWQPARGVAVLADLRSENLEAPQPYALYLRVTPFESVPLHIQAGRIPPVFGRFARQAYASDNPVIGYPLAYQYLTALRADAIPASVSDLFRMRGRGWQLGYPVGDATPRPGLPIVSAFRYDTGVQARYTPGVFDISAAVTIGTLSNPGDLDSGDDNAGRQWVLRAASEPVPGLIAGFSAARGAWLSDGLADARTEHDQRALGVDGEYSRGHWLVRGEWMSSTWRMPTLTSSLTARSGFVEGRVRVHPRAFVAGRVDRLSFSRLAGPSISQTWDAPVSRIEAAAGWYFRRNLVAKGAWQYNWRDGGRVRRKAFVAAQLLYWF